MTLAAFNELIVQQIREGALAAKASPPVEIHCDIALDASGGVAVFPSSDTHRIRYSLRLSGGELV